MVIVTEAERRFQVDELCQFEAGAMGEGLGFFRLCKEEKRERGNMENIESAMAMIARPCMDLTRFKYNHANPPIQPRGNLSQRFKNRDHQWFCIPFLFIDTTLSFAPTGQRFSQPWTSPRGTGYREFSYQPNGPTVP
jgi:hypothetical protein